MKIKLCAAAAVFCLPSCGQLLQAQPCPRPQAGSVVEEPEDLRSHDGVLEVQLTASDPAQPDGSARYCYTDSAGHESRNLRVHPGDLVILDLTNQLTDVSNGNTGSMPAHTHAHSAANPCSSRLMSPVTT